MDAVDAAIEAAQAVTDRPTLICCKTVIGKGAPTKAGTGARARRGAGRKGSRGARARRSAGRIRRSRFPHAIYAAWNARERGALLEADWNARFAAYRAAHPGTRRRVRAPHRRRAARRTCTRRPRRFVAAQAAKAETVATRKASQQAIEAFAPLLPEMLGGSADLTGSVFTNWSGSKPVAQGRRPATTSTSACASSA